MSDLPINMKPVDFDKISQEVRFVQGMLAASGMWNGPIDGQWSDDVANALVAYQASRQLTQSGRLDQATRAHFASSLQQFSGGADPIVKTVTDLYGPGMVAYLNHPELGPILKQAAGTGVMGDGAWSPERLWERLATTGWYREQSDKTRQWDDLTVTNAAEANRQRGEMMAGIGDQAEQLGLTLSAKDLREMSEDYLRLGWSDDQLTDVLSSMLSRAQAGEDTGRTTASNDGKPAFDANQLRQMAAAYHLTLSDQEAQSWANEIAGGTATLETISTRMHARAKALYSYGDLPGLIDAGVTPEDYFGEHKARIARELGMAAEQIDLRDPKWAKITGFVDGQGNRRPMTVQEAVDHVRSDDSYGWSRSAAADSKVGEFLTLVNQTFRGV